MVGTGRRDLKSVGGVESSEFGCHVTVGTRGERRVKDIAEALTWVTQRNREMCRRPLGMAGQPSGCASK